jgi:hypothetical protein
MTKLPEPVELSSESDERSAVWGYTEDQMLQFRRDSLEDAADTLEHGFVDDEGHHIQYAKEIRKLLETT